jgi:hypothetical protein
VFLSRVRRELPVLETPRLMLRAFTLGDAPSVQSLASAPEVADTTNIPHPYPPNGAVNWIRRHDDERKAGLLTFAVVRKSEGDVIGAATLGLERNHDKAEIAYWIGAPFWNNGYATESARRLVDFGFGELYVNRIYGRYFLRNPASRRVMEKVGLIYEATLRQDFRHGAGFEDIGICGLLYSEWARNHPNHAIPS